MKHAEYTNIEDYVEKDSVQNHDINDFPSGLSLLELSENEKEDELIVREMDE